MTNKERKRLYTNCGVALVSAFGGGGGCGFAGGADEDGLLALMVEVYVEDGGAAMIPDLLGDGEVEQNHTFGGLAGVDHRLAEEGLRDEGLEARKGGVDVGEVVFFGGAGVELLAVGGGESGGEVLEEEREVEAVVDAEGGEDVEVVLGLAVANDDAVAFEDGVGGKDGGAGDGDVRCPVWRIPDCKGKSDAKDQECQENRGQQIASSGLSELEVRHWDENSKGVWFSED
jgi:hypothetical protein